MGELERLRLPYDPIEQALARRAAADDLTVGAWLTNHPRAGHTYERMRRRCLLRGWISAAIADRFAIRLLGQTLDELYGPDWDQQEAAA